jgi:hypothetical protein
MGGNGGGNGGDDQGGMDFEFFGDPGAQTSRGDSGQGITDFTDIGAAVGGEALDLTGSTFEDNTPGSTFADIGPGLTEQDVDDELKARSESNLNATVKGAKTGLTGALFSLIKNDREQSELNPLSPAAQAVVDAQLADAQAADSGGAEGVSRPAITRPPVTKPQQGGVTTTPAVEQPGIEPEVTPEVVEQREKVRRRRGQRSNLLTGALGLLTEPNIRKRSLLRLG